MKAKTQPCSFTRSRAQYYFQTLLRDTAKEIETLHIPAHTGSKESYFCMDSPTDIQRFRGRQLVIFHTAEIKDR